jgi:hypothetical protein
MMMLKGARPKPTAQTESGWTFPPGQGTPAGGDRKFAYGALKGKTFIDVTLEHPEQYFAICKSKTPSNEAKEYIAWVDKSFEVDKNAKQINERGILPTANATAPSTRLDAASCKHANVHHKGSSVRYRRFTCKDCGEVWQEEKDVPTEESETCAHRHTDHRGSNKFVRKTFCKDCGTYIDSVVQGLAKSLQADNPGVSKAEQVLLDSVSDHEHLTREQAIIAAKQMIVECEQLELGEYRMLDIATMFVDCADRAIAASDVHMNAGKRVQFGNIRQFSHSNDV